MNNEQQELINHQSTGNQIKNDPKAQKKAMKDEDSQSEWSLESLEEIKGINIKLLQAQEDNEGHHHKQKPMPQPKFPEKPSVFINAPLHQIGKVVFVVGELLIVEAISGMQVVDLDNWVSDQTKNLIGFVIDVLGRIENPFYAIKLQQATNLNQWLGKSVYYIEGTSKVLKDEDIKSLQSKSAAEVEQPVDDDSDEQMEKPQRKYSDQRRERRRSPNWRRDNRFDRHNEDSRDRTRERQPHNRNVSRSRNQHNQKYLESMYNMHYTEMMRLYNGGYRPNQTQQYPGIFNNNTQEPNMFNMPMPNPPPNFSHANVAQFGSAPQQFYGQSCPQLNYQNNPNNGNPNNNQWNNQKK